MKKLLTLITLIGMCIPAIHGMEANVSADVQKKYENLKVLIQNADVETFKPTFDALESVEKRSLGTGLEQSVVETKAAIAKEIADLGDNNKNWSKIIKGGLATLCGVSGVADIYAITFSRDESVEGILGIPNTLFSILPAALSIVSIALYAKVTGKTKKTKAEMNQIMDKVFTGVRVVIGSIAAYKALPYGVKTFKAGLNYKQYLQDQLTNLDAIAAHIAQAKEQIN